MFDFYYITFYYISIILNFHFISLKLHFIFLSFQLSLRSKGASSKIKLLKIGAMFDYFDPFTCYLLDELNYALC